MKERPILFSSPMVKAILEGRKTQTRRIIKPQPVSVGDVYEKPYGEPVGASVPWQGFVGSKCPYGQIGDRLWVRETWQETTWLNPSDENYGYIYRASENGEAWEENDESFTWRPSIFMPRNASRITLEITNVRVERLQEITEEDAIAEGVAYSEESRDYDDYSYNNKNCDAYGLPTAKQSVQTLWDKINGKRAPWESNPWVWVIEFKHINQ